MNLLLSINDILVMKNVGLLVGIIVPLLVLLFSAKYRGIWASVWLLPFLYAALMFAGSFEAVNNILSGHPIVAPIIDGVDVLMAPFMSIHSIIMDLLSLIAPGVAIWQDTILVASWFPLALYGILWLLFLAIFKKKRRRKKARRYEDDF